MVIDSFIIKLSNALCRKNVHSKVVCVCATTQPIHSPRGETDKLPKGLFTHEK